MAAAAALVDRLLRRLASDSRRLELPSNIDEHVAHVWRTMLRLRDVVVSLESQYFRVRTEVQDWMRKIDQIVYDLEDLLDEFEDQDSVGSQRSGCAAKATPFCSSSPFLLHSVRGNRMKALRKRLDVLAKDSVIFSLMQHSRCDLEQYDNQEEFYRAAIIGRDNDKTKIKESILQNDAETLSIIPIVGFVGLGKTTLARLIFRDHGEGWNLDLRIWVDLNGKFDLKKIAADIVSQANEAKEERPSEVNTNIDIHEDLQLLKNRLQEVLHDKSCLIVLDGLCSTDKIQLGELKEMLRGTNKCSKIIVTTSSEITAELMHTVPPYRVLPLSDDDCWAIFSKRAFGAGDDGNVRLKEIGRQIVKRCQGIPALAHTLGLIVHNQAMDVWLAARDEEIWKLETRCSTKIEVFSLFNQIYNMSSALRLCFIYLSIFSKGSVIDKEKLIRQWIALDMIGSKHETLPSYVHGEMYIQDLLSIYFLQVRKTHLVNGTENRTEPTALYMHDFAHDFARHVARDDTIILDDREMSGYAERPTFHYALLTYYRGQSTLCSSLLTRARALHFQNTEAIKLHRESFKLLKHLRVLNLSGSCIGEIPASVGHLKHLRYLDFSDLKIQTLPSSMSTLTNLEALDLSNTSLRELPSFICTLPKLNYLNLQGCHILQNLPATFGLLQRLEHLRLSYCYDVGELADSLCNLQDLRFLDLSSCTELTQLPHLFGNLMSLEDLNMSGCFNLKQLPESFGDLYFLRFLDISSCYQLQQLPGSLTNLMKLEILILRRCCRLQNLPPSFGNIQYLRILDLAGCEALQVSTEILTTNLEYLNLERCQKLQTKPNCFQNFTRLKFLNLSQCRSNKSYFQSLSYLFNLEYLNLSQTVFDITVSFEKLQKLHTLDITGCVIHPSSGVPQLLPDMIGKMTGLKFVLTVDSVIVASLPKHIRCSVGIDEQWHITTDELVIPDLTGGSRGLGIAERVNLQNRPELRFLKLEWMPTSWSAAGGVGEIEVFEKLQPNQGLEHFKLVGYAGAVFPTWMMDSVMTLLPNLVSLHLFHLENCKNLPPLCELRNLRYLHIKDVPNLRNFEMGLSGGPQPFRKLTHLNLESLFNLEELSVLLSTSEEKFMFPTLEELSVVSCCKLIFKPSFPKCLKYEIKESNNILSCGEPIGPSSSPSPVQIEITGCRIPRNFWQWLRSLRTLEKVVIVACVGEDGQVLTSLGLLAMKDQGPSSSYAANETVTDSSLRRDVSHEMFILDTSPEQEYVQVGATTNTGYGGSIFQNLRLKVLLASTGINSSKTSEDLSTLSSSTFKKSTVSGTESTSGGTKSTVSGTESTVSGMESTVSGVGVDETYLKATDLNSASLKVFTFEELKIVTGNFSPGNLLGNGWYGKVYKGWLDETLKPSRYGIGMTVAVKQYHPEMVKGDLQERVGVLRSISHTNLLKLLGYYMDDNIFLVYEYMARGSFSDHLFRRGATPLSWSLRINILSRAARGLAFLHTLERPVIHRNVKTSNILLDSNYNAKLSYPEPGDWLSHVSTRVMGTYGYAAPECISTGHVYLKSDIYSFGVVLVESLSGLMVIDPSRCARDRNLVDWAKPYLADRRRLNRVMDLRLGGQYSSKEALQVAQLALSCLSSDPRARPSMIEVTEVLENINSMNTVTRERKHRSLQLKTLGALIAGASSTAGVP